MKLWMGVEGEADIADIIRPLRNEIEGKVNEWLEKKSFVNNKLESWDVIIILRNDDNFNEITRYSKKKKETDFRLKIDYKLFKHEKDEIRYNMIINMLVRSLDILESKGVSGLNTVKDYLLYMRK